jgi:hypothetical protein
MAITTFAMASINSSKKEFEYQEFLEAPNINYGELLELEQKKNSNQAMKYEKLAIKKYYFKKKLKIDHDLNTDLSKTYLEDISKWYNKEYVLDNALCALGKRTFNDSEDPYFRNMGNKIEYLNKILNVFGFGSLLD